MFNCICKPIKLKYWKIKGPSPLTWPNLAANQAEIQAQVNTFPSKMIDTIKGETLWITKAIKEGLFNQANQAGPSTCSWCKFLQSSSNPPPAHGSIQSLLSPSKSYHSRSTQLSLQLLISSLRRSLHNEINHASSELNKAMAQDKQEVMERIKKIEESVDDSIKAALQAVGTRLKDVKINIAIQAARLDYQTSRIMELNNTSPLGSCKVWRTD